MSIGGILNISDGRTVVILLPHIMRYNLPDAGERIVWFTGCLHLPIAGDEVDNANRVITSIKHILSI